MKKDSSKSKKYIPTEIHVGYENLVNQTINIRVNPSTKLNIEVRNKDAFGKQIVKGFPIDTSESHAMVFDNSKSITDIVKDMTLEDKIHNVAEQLFGDEEKASHCFVERIYKDDIDFERDVDWDSPKYQWLDPHTHIALEDSGFINSSYINDITPSYGFWVGEDDWWSLHFPNSNVDDWKNEEFAKFSLWFNLDSCPMDGEDGEYFRFDTIEEVIGFKLSNPQYFKKFRSFKKARYEFIWNCMGFIFDDACGLKHDFLSDSDNDTRLIGMDEEWCGLTDSVQYDWKQFVDSNLAWVQRVCFDSLSNSMSDISDDYQSGKVGQNQFVEIQGNILDEMKTLKELDWFFKTNKEGGE